MRTLKIAWLVILFCLPFKVVAQQSQEAIAAFVKRIVKGHAVDFVTEYTPAENGKDVFELESKNGKIILRGSNGLSIASALNCYLQKYCHCIVTWNGSNMQLPAQLPVIETKIHKATPYKYRYYLNYCTFNYTMAWWDWDRWQKEIDWMALNGINMPLALTGEEAVWQDVYKSLGFTNAELDKFFSGPAYFSWLWMGNIDAWGGPLPQHWKDTHKALQKKILAAERALGMLPVLPAFTGHVPPGFTNRYPKAKVKKTNWGAGFPDVYILDPSDPMFVTIGKKFIEAQTAAFGTDHFYSADTFNENVPPTSDSSYLDEMSKKVYASMASADNKAVWVMQGWMFHYNASYWKRTQVQALLNAVPNENMIILDLYSESHPEWKKNSAYYGKPWIWCMLHNFGGNISLWGRMENAANDPSAALQDPSSGKMEGIGLTPEGTEQNPALYQLMMQNVWQDQPVDVQQWLQHYALNRYGVANDSINKAWAILQQTVYSGGLSEGGQESIIVSRPTFDSASPRVLTKLDYNPLQLVGAWALFIREAPKVQGSDGFTYDLVDITRQVLANYATPLQQKFAQAYRNKDTAAFKKYSTQFLTLLDDIDRLLSTREDFMLGKWISQARANGITPAESDLYEFNARDLVTLWDNKESELHEYSNRQWAGLIKGFYKPRWAMFFNGLNKSLAVGQAFDFNAFAEKSKDWEWEWVNSKVEKYNTVPMGNSVAVAEQLFKKYSEQIKKAYE
jgi:alpha-N-acetylglucosaminidase